MRFRLGLLLAIVWPVLAHAQSDFTIQGPVTYNGSQFSHSGSRLTSTVSGGCGSGTVNKILKFIGSTSCGDSNITDDGSGAAITLSAGGALLTTPSQASGGGNFNITLGSGSGSGSDGGSLHVVLGNGGNSSGNGGGYTLNTGGATDGSSGSFSLTTGDIATSGNVGSFSFTAGSTPSGNGGGATFNLSDGADGGVNGIFKVLGGDGAVVGTPTGGAQGPGSINVESCFVNGVACATGSGGITQLTGSVLAGPGTGSQSATLATNQPDAHTWAATQTFGAVLGTISTQSGTTYTLAATDCGTEINFTNAGTITVTIPNSLPVGCNIALRQGGTGAVTPTAGAGATLNSPHAFTETFAQYSIIGISVVTNSGGSAAVADFTGDGQ